MVLGEGGDRWYHGTRLEAVGTMVVPRGTMVPG